MPSYDVNGNQIESVMTNSNYINNKILNGDSDLKCCCPVVSLGVLAALIYTIVKVSI